MTTRHTPLLALALLALASQVGAGDTTAPPAAERPAAPSAVAAVPQPGGYSNIDNASLQQLLDDGVVLIDIRRQEEWRATGLVPGSTPITFFDARGRINPQFVPAFTAAAQPDQPVALICRTGNRTQFASRAIAQQLGYKEVYNVTRGITGWIAEKRPVERWPAP